MLEKEMNANGTRTRTLKEMITSDGRMDEKKALGIIRTLCSQHMKDEKSVNEKLVTFHPERIMLSQDGRLSFLNSKTDSVKKNYIPPEYRKGFTSRESIDIYGLGILLLFLVTGQEEKSAIDVDVRNPVIREAITKCTAVDSKQRFQSLAELNAFVSREEVFPKRQILRISVALLLSVALAVSVLVYQKGKAQGTAEGETIGNNSGYREGYEDGASDAPGIGIEEVTDQFPNGNLPGNRNAKGGAFAVCGEKSIYFIYRGSIYEMDPYTKKTECIAEHENISNLEYQKGYLYYLANGILTCMNVDNYKEETLSTSYSGNFCVYNGTVFLDDEGNTGYLYGIDVATGNLRQLNAKTEYDSLNVTENKLYFSNPEMNGCLFCCDFDGGTISRLLSTTCRDVDVGENGIYCLTVDEDENGSAEEDRFRLLIHLETEGGDTEILTNRPVRRFIATKSGIFYVPEDSGNLEWMTPDGKTKYIVCDFTIKDFNIAGRWIFYRLDDSETLYRMRINGTEADRLF